MDIFEIIWNLFSFESKTIHQLINISSYIDQEKSTPGILINSTEEDAIIACLVVAMQNEPSLTAIGRRMYNSINSLIVKKNSSLIDSDQNLKEYKKTNNNAQLGTFRIIQTRTGYKFALIASNGEWLASSDVYSTSDSCYKGILSVQRNLSCGIENQTEKNYQQIKNPKFEVYANDLGEYSFRLKSSNGQILMSSESYKSIERCLQVISIIKGSAYNADVEK